MQIDGSSPAAPSWGAVVNWMGEETLVHATEFVIRFQGMVVASEAALAAAAQAVIALAPSPMELVSVDNSGRATFRLPTVAGLQAVLDRLAGAADSVLGPLGLPGIDYLQPNHIHTIQAAPTPNDTFMGDWPYQTIHAADAWQLHAGGDPRVLVGVIDSGIAMDAADHVAHDDLDAGRFDLGANFVHAGRPVRDDNSHGTMITGIIAATRDNHEGVPGMTPGRVRICKTIGSDGHGLETAFADAVDEMVGVADASGVHLIINYSAGGPQDSPEVARACEKIQNRGHLLCAAAGRTARVLFPAKSAERFSNVLCVGGCDKFDHPVGPDAPPVAFAAPSFDVRSTKPVGVVDNNRYALGDGTSIGTAFVTGLAALVWSKHPEWPAATVKDAIVRSARPTAHLPVIDAAAALSL